MNNLRTQLYQSYGAFSKKYLNILNCMAKNETFNLSEIAKQTNYSFKMITTVVNQFESNFEKTGNTYKINNNFKLDIFQSVSELSLDLDKVKLINEYKSIVSKFNNDKPNLDHISATAETAINRAIYVAENYDFQLCKFAMLGDHDFTTIALKLVFENANISVFEIDEDILKFINLLNYNNFISVYADFRVGIFKDFKHCFDVVFTDPPYTVEGMDCFIKNAKFLCKNNEYSTILCAYGCGDLSIKNGLNVQKSLINNGLYIESLVQKFNKFELAESLGYCSDLYVLRLTNLAYTENALKLPNSWQIYTHGVMALESKSETDNSVKRLALNKQNKNDISLMEVLRANVLGEKVTTFDTLEMVDSKGFEYNYLSLLLSLSFNKLVINQNKTVNSLLNRGELSKFYSVTKSENCHILTPNNNLGGILAQKSYIKLKNIIIKHFSLHLNLTKNDIKKIISENQLLQTYQEVPVFAIPVDVLIKIIDIF